MSKTKKAVGWIMLLIWMVIIFLMSHQPGEVSSSQSDLVIKIFEFLGINLNSYFEEMATLIIRKAAHFTEYLILFILLYRVLCFYIDKKSAKLYSLLGVFLYAGSDEIHQYFIPGRNMALKDVIIDTSGGFFAMVITWIYEKIKKLKNK